jgi:hypothetical protein
MSQCLKENNKASTIFQKAAEFLNPRIIFARMGEIAQRIRAFTLETNVMR